MPSETVMHALEWARIPKAERERILADQDRQQSVVNAIRGPDKPTLGETIKAYTALHI